jgi:ribosomal protein S18 acetylase RimI-like enzyme
MTVREASAADIQAIREVARASWEADYPGILSRETAEEGVEEWYTPERLRAALVDSKALLFVAVEEDSPVGFVHGAVTGEGEGHVLRLYVHPDHRRRGVGGRLLERARDELVAYGVDRIYAQTLADNDLGNAFYRDRGFEKVDEGETTIAGNSFRENTYALQT